MGAVFNFTHPCINIMIMPPVPRLSRFCFCLDVHTGVKYFSIGLGIVWIINSLGALFGEKRTGGDKIWTVIWCLANLAAYVLVLIAMKQNKKKFIIPALVIAIFDVVVSIIQAVLWFIILQWFWAFFLLVVAGVCLYYALGLKTVFDDLSSGPPATEPV